MSLTYIQIYQKAWLNGSQQKRIVCSVCHAGEGTHPTLASLASWKALLPSLRCWPQAHFLIQDLLLSLAHWTKTRSIKNTHAHVFTRAKLEANPKMRIEIAHLGLAGFLKSFEIITPFLVFFFPPPPRPHWLTRVFYPESFWIISFEKKNRDV